MQPADLSVAISAGALGVSLSTFVISRYRDRRDLLLKLLDRLTTPEQQDGRRLIHQMASTGVNIGATVILRRDVPGVRFTALRFGTADCRMLVHHQKGKDVHFRQYSRSDFPVYWLCQDLISSYLGDSRSGSGTSLQSGQSS
jgi:hypothetical protein